MRPVLKLWFDLLQSDLAQGFLGSRSPEGETWEPLKRRRSPIPPHNPGRRPLIDFGNLLASVAGQGVGHIEQVSDDGGIFGTSVKYAAFHQVGTKRIPARPFLGAPKESADELADMAADELIRQISQL